jgi:hypothetical protein
MKSKIYIKISLAIVFGVMACKKAYNPTIATSSSILVIEGFINTGNDTTIIKLTRTLLVSSGNGQKLETKAVVTVEDDQNKTYTLTEATGGKYQAPPLGLSNDRSYRLRVKTTDGLIYLSDFEKPKISPAIDSVGYKVTDNGVDIYANTHDANKASMYYRWEYEETWRFHSKFQSLYISDGKAIVSRPADMDIYNCFGNDISHNVIINSTASLQQDVVYQTPITTLPSESEKVETRYSILVKQYALSKTAYAFWTNLKKNTETLGSIFDAQPSQIPGNIHCISNAAQPVIGYISAGTFTQKRIFIDNSVLPKNWLPKYPYDCEMDSLYYSAPFTGENQVKNYLINQPHIQIPVQPLITVGGIIGFFGGTYECADCTIRGRKQQPAFWK